MPQPRPLPQPDGTHRGGRPMLWRFLLCSGLAAVANLCTGYLLYGLFGLSGGREYGLSVALAFLAGTGISFVLNRRFTFAPSGRPTAAEALDFCAVSLGGLALTTLLAHLLRPHLHAAGPRLPPEALAHIAAVGLTALYSFVAHRYISFRHGADQPPLPVAKGLVQ